MVNIFHTNFLIGSFCFKGGKNFCNFLPSSPLSMSKQKKKVVGTRKGKIVGVPPSTPRKSAPKKKIEEEEDLMEEAEEVISEEEQIEDEKPLKKKKSTQSVNFHGVTVNFSEGEKGLNGWIEKPQTITLKGRGGVKIEYAPNSTNEIKKAGLNVSFPLPVSGSAQFVDEVVNSMEKAWGKLSKEEFSHSFKPFYDTDSNWRVFKFNLFQNADYTIDGKPVEKRGMSFQERKDIPLKKMNVDSLIERLSRDDLNHEVEVEFILWGITPYWNENTEKLILNYPIRMNSVKVTRSWPRVVEQ